jgi:hypothetical protein
MTVDGFGNDCGLRRNLLHRLASLVGCHRRPRKSNPQFCGAAAGHIAGIAIHRGGTDEFQLIERERMEANVRPRGPTFCGHQAERPVAVG